MEGVANRKSNFFKKSAIRKHDLSGEVLSLLRSSYGMELNIALKVLKYHFSEDFLPRWYFTAYSATEIANHIFIITHILAPGKDLFAEASADGKGITYFINLGQDYPGKLAALIEECIDMDIVAFDFVQTRSGIQIVNLQKRGRESSLVSIEMKPEIDQLKEWLREYAHREKFQFFDEFSRTLVPGYWHEELNLFFVTSPRRVLRHLSAYEEVMRSGTPVVRIEDTSLETDETNEKRSSKEQRFYMAVRNPDSRFVLTILTEFRERGINIIRAYYDVFEHPDNPDSVGILSIYTSPEEKLEALVPFFSRQTFATAERSKQKQLEAELEELVRTISNPRSSGKKIENAFDALNRLIDENTDASSALESGNMLLNSLSDFMLAARQNKIADNIHLMRLLISFDSFEEFFVETRRGELRSNKPGFRIQHNNARGYAYKGGLRIDPIVEFSEVASLAFMMTWKCARLKVLFGGGKGGLMIQPGQYRKNKLDYFDTLSNFGKSLFLVTGPFRDVPAGDVGCGPEEIGHMFEGFKAAVRELALIAYGIKDGVSYIGNHVISIDQAIMMLQGFFGLDFLSQETLEKLVTDEKYVELVAAAQITGKPKMGIPVRNGATGRGLYYAVLAAVGRLYLDAKWQPAKKLTPEEHEAVEKLSGVSEKRILETAGVEVIPDEVWTILETKVFPKLLAGKRVVLQGFGKVGRSILEELNRYEVNFIAVADAGGAVIGDGLNLETLKESADGSDDRSVVHAKKNVREVIHGAKEGAAVLTLPCDILIPAALENSITAENAPLIRARLVVCGSNGPNTSKAEQIFVKRAEEVTVIYDFLANAAGVTASYFEWLRNLTERFRFEAEYITKQPFDLEIMTPYIMPEFIQRIRRILSVPESPETTQAWNTIIRDIMIAAVNDDYSLSNALKIPMRIAGFMNTQLRVLSAALLRMDETARRGLWQDFSGELKTKLRPFLEHPESTIINSAAAEIVRQLY